MLGFSRLKFVLSTHRTLEQLRWADNTISTSCTRAMQSMQQIEIKPYMSGSQSHQNLLDYERPLPNTLGCRTKDSRLGFWAIHTVIKTCPPISGMLSDANSMLYDSSCSMVLESNTLRQEDVSPSSQYSVCRRCRYDAALLIPCSYGGACQESSGCEFRSAP